MNRLSTASRLRGALVLALAAACQSESIRPELVGPQVDPAFAKGGGTTGGSTVASSTFLGTLGGPKSWGQAISDAGEVVGMAWRPDCTGAAFCWATSTTPNMVELPGLRDRLAGPTGHAYDIAGNTIVGYAFLTDTKKPAARWSRNPDGSWTVHDLGTLGGDWAFATAVVNVDGVETIVGSSHRAPPDAAGNLQYRAFVWSGSGPMQQLPVDGGSEDSYEDADAEGINSARTIVGDVRDFSFKLYAVVWTWNGSGWDKAQLLPELPGYAAHRATAINDNGEIVGYAHSADGSRWRAVRWVPEGATYKIYDDIGTLGGAKAEARGINSRGQIVGRSLINNRTWRAFVWSPGAGIKELAPLSGDSESYANDINNAVPAQIAGLSTTTNGGVRAVRWQLLQ